MFCPSRSLMPSACVLLAPSEPARSTRFSYDIFIFVLWIPEESLMLSCELMLMRNTV